MSRDAIDPQIVMNTLKHLADDCRERALGFGEYAAYVSMPALQRLLWANAEECRAAAAELEMLINGPGAAGQRRGTVAPHGGAELEHVLRRNSDRAVLEECLRGQEGMRYRYERALSMPMPTGIRRALQRHFSGMLRYADKIRALRLAPGLH
ncbi:MAG: PA2169 family four-helix-bundle protein [Moraxellaceae bacterium]|nr:PA2169 family four-helix-bundle protein [Moraxellaceae bacterium]